MVFRPGAEEEPCGPPGICPPWCLLGAWASHHGVDDDLALLICACAAAHAAGPALDFEEYGPERRVPAPTLISTAGDLGFYRAVKAAVEPLLPIQRDLVAQYGDPVEREAAELARRKRASPPSPLEALKAAFEKSQARSWPFWKNPAGDMDPDQQRGGRARFVLEGALPAKPVRFLKTCHLYSAMSVAETERLPRSARRRDVRIDILTMALRGYRMGAVSIRGFMRFEREDLEWLTDERLDLMEKTLPVESLARGPVAAAAGEGRMREFGRLHRTVLRRVLALRFDRADCGVDFRSDEARQRFRKLREDYRTETVSVTTCAPMAVILPDLFVWYLLQLGKSAWLDLDEMEVAGHAIAAALRLRLRVAVFHDRQTALRRARERLALAGKLVARMRCLAGPCKRRDLARGLANQKMERIAPVIDSLVGHGVFTRTSKVLSMGDAEGFDRLRADDFMEPLADVPLSVTRRLALFEERQAAANRAKEGAGT